MIKTVGKRGDTLVEVMLAVGIFSMVAVAVVAVMSGGTNSSQTALETTLTREEIDNQAEALRFIHKAYVADVKNGTNSKFGELWQDITSKVVNGSSAGNHNFSDTYHPDKCGDLYDGSGKARNDNVFVIDTQAITDYVHGAAGATNPDSVIIQDKLFEASTYPHLMYSKNNKTDLETNLIDRDSTAVSGNKLYRAEGIFVMAVQDPNSTAIAGNLHQSKPAYYDFYIRTCWYGTGDQSPSTISTVMRLYNPDINAAN